MDSNDKMNQSSPLFKLLCGGELYSLMLSFLTVVKKTPQGDIEIADIKSLKSLARVCKRTFEPTAILLWRDTNMHRFTHAARVLPHHQTTYGRSVKLRTTNIRKEMVLNLKIYAQSVRSFCYDEGKPYLHHESIGRLLAVMKIGPSLFPNIQHLTMPMPEYYDARLAPFLASSITHLTVNIPYKDTSTLDMIANTCPSLIQLSLTSVATNSEHANQKQHRRLDQESVCHRSSSPWVIQWLTSMAHRFGNLQVVAVRTPSSIMSPLGAINNISQFPSLKELTLSIWNSTGALAPPLPHPIPVIKFPHLTSLSIDYGSASDLDRMLQCLCGQLQGLVAINLSYSLIDRKPEPHSENALFQHTVEALSGNTLTTLRIHRAHMLYHVQGNPLDAGIFQQVCNFVHLRSLYIAMSLSIPLNDRMLVQIARCIPNLETFDVRRWDSSPGQTNTEENAVTLVGLAVFVETAQNLAFLGLSFNCDSDVDVLSDLGPERNVNGGSRVVELGVGPGYVVDAELTARQLLQIFPNVEVIDTRKLKEWAKRVSTLDRSYENYAYDLQPTTLYTRWRDVARQMDTIRPLDHPRDTDQGWRAVEDLSASEGSVSEEEDLYEFESDYDDESTYDEESH
ncbi:hypothetical protein CONPUDRAFT_147910 [Coniophora puteana RWD-64-598 SS2]|uniref:F-box domain-containing protein n=1 Tax=Coniophora puteana (strain RWD-64-598) TaxID=741705 RepID=R7SEH2_CONPW|nr:uncharacterized protein CONPUDRAFT_147910 [Coniophora puteana RWD-64-598 SS2]EIW74142.1 hypothetical protein CONPUDRAFT_147910 [Coniophora puteana RWD-64-598 SS2]